MTGRWIKVAVGVVVAAVAIVKTDGVLHSSANCGMQLNNDAVAFCETFDQPSPVTNRSGQLDGTLWGVSRLTGNSNFGGTFVGWGASVVDACGVSLPAQPDASDVIICNGQLRESTNDEHTVTTLAIYPKQPFDFAGRTGTVAFDVTNDTSGSHGAWPEFWLTDQPVPAPFTHYPGPICDFCSIPRNALGIDFSAQEGACPGGWRAGTVQVVRNYVAETTDIGSAPAPSGLKIQETGCASLSSGPNGGLNHIELRISQNQIDVYATDAGGGPLHRINTITNANLTFTRGLIWIEDSHYNASKSPRPEDSAHHTFAWDNVAFDGPTPYRDLSYDVLDPLTPASDGTINLGWRTSPSNPVTLTTLPMAADAIATATAAGRGALLMFNSWQPFSTINYTINGHAFSAPAPWAGLSGSGVPGAGNRSIALSVPFSALVPGPQQIVLSADVDTLVANVNIVLLAATPVPSAGGGG